MMEILGTLLRLAIAMRRRKHQLGNSVCEAIRCQKQRRGKVELRKL